VSFPSIRPGAALLLCGLLLSACAGAGPGPGSTDARQRVFIDPETGEKRAPTDEELAQMAQPKSSRKREAIALPDGTYMVPAEANMHKVNATRTPDGKLEVHCEDPAHGHE
jgi:hypothetical protein